MARMRTQFGKDIRESDVCVLCGERPATTKEHIPPKSIFRKSPPDDVSVPACERCNNSTKLEDEYLRQVTTGASFTEEGREVWRQKVRPKLPLFPKTRAGLQKGLAAGTVTIP